MKTSNGHTLYESSDFTDEEYARRNQLAVMVIDGGLGVCKNCGACERELDESCKVRQQRKAREAHRV